MSTIKKVGRWGVFTEPIPKKLKSALYNRLSYQREGYQFMPNPAWSWVRFYNRKKRCFPWGLKNAVIGILEQWQKQFGESFGFETEIGLTTVDGIGCYDKIEGMRPYQVDAINALISNDGGILAMPTGSGKTRTAIEFLKKVNFNNALIVVTTIDLRNQWNDIIKEDLILKNKIIYVMTYQSIKGDLNWLNNEGIVIFDEVHHVSAKSLYNIAMKCSNATLIGLSATPFRAYRPEIMKINAAVGDIVYQISMRELIEQGYLCDAEIRIKDLEQDIEVEYWDTYHEIYDKAIVNNNKRNQNIYKIAYGEAVEGLVLILVDKIEHGQKILNELKDYIHNHYLGDDTENKIIFVHGSSKKRKEKFDDIKAGKYDIVIASKIYGEGVDIPNLKTLILAGGGKSSVKIVQQIGRLLRIFPGKEKAIIYDFTSDIKYLKKHFQVRLEIYKGLFEVKWV